MDSDFYNSIFPQVGLRVLATFKGGLKAAPTHTFYDANDDLIEAAKTFDGLKKNVYHGCAVYKTSDNRKGDNVLAIKALWLDLDVGPNKPYDTKKEAAAHVEQFISAVGLPSSHVVSSGGGVHSYFAFTKPILPEQWDRLSEVFAACLDHYGVKHDTSRTQDKASILRIPGTHNYKTDPAKQVKLVRLGAEAPAAEIYRKLKAYADANGVIVGFKAPKGTPAVTNDLIGNPVEYPPSDGFKVAEECPVLEEVADTGGDVSYEIWWRAMGVAKHTTHPDLTAQNWTAARANTGHSKFDWQGTMAAWTAGPTTCAEFNKHSTKCATCPHAGKVKSPIQLGIPEQPIISPLATQPAMKTVAARDWEFAADWVMTLRGNATKTGYSNGVMTMYVGTDDSGAAQHVPFCNRYWQVMQRIRTMDKVWKLEIGYEEYPGQPHKTFLLDGSDVVATDRLKQEFANREIYLHGPKNAVYKAQQLIMHDQDLLYGRGEESAEHPALGWTVYEGTTRSEVTGDFVLGDEIFRPKLPPQKIRLGDHISESLRTGFATKGTTAEWVQLIDMVYNRPSAEAYQFVIAASFAAPLVGLVPGGGGWYGIPIVLGGDSGAAKTSTAMAAMSIYAQARTLTFNAPGGKEAQGDTVNALTAKVGNLRSLPLIMDEMTNADPERVGAIMYMLATGKGRDRLGPDGKLLPNTTWWSTLSIVTSNDALHEVLKGLRSQATQEATQARSFQIALSRKDLKTVFHDVSSTTIDIDLLDNQYGCVGREWIQFLVNNRVKIAALLEQKRKEYKIDPNEQSLTRFYKDLILTVEVAAGLAQYKKFIKWDVPKMIKWAKDQILVLKDSISDRDWDGTISDFVASLHGRTIVSKNLKLGPGRRSNPEMPLEPLSTSQPPVARKAIDDMRFVVTANALKDWAQQRRIMPSTLIGEMAQKGYLVNWDGEKAETKLINIGSGTTVTRPQAPCYELDFNKVVHANGSDDVTASNVVPISAAKVTELVTAEAAPAAESSVSL